VSNAVARSEGEREVVDHLRVINTSVPLAELWVLVPLFLVSLFIVCLSWLFVEVRSQFSHASLQRPSHLVSITRLSPSSKPSKNMEEIVPAISPAFSPSVLWWEPEILAWSQEYELPPNLIALVMQIESCGDPQASSIAGAIGLFQVMPYHFTSGDNPFQPSTNAHRGLEYLSEALHLADGNVDRALAGYNGGHGVISRPLDSWADETHRYVRWGTGIWSEVTTGSATSSTLSAWLDAGGERLCDSAMDWQASQSSGA
jgi:hypothetical protein